VQAASCPEQEKFELEVLVEEGLVKIVKNNRAIFYETMRIRDKESLAARQVIECKLNHDELNLGSFWTLTKAESENKNLIGGF
jgi:hypothetical protein